MSNLQIFDPKEILGKDIVEGMKNGKVIVMFTAAWCGPCKRIKPVFATLAEKNTNISFQIVDCDAFQDVSAYFQVSAMPTFMFFNNGVLLDTIVGASQTLLTKKVSDLSATKNESLLDKYS